MDTESFPEKADTAAHPEFPAVDTPAEERPAAEPPAMALEGLAGVGPVEAVPPGVGTLKTFAACLAGALVPGVGHAILGKWDRALVFLGSITLMFAIGLRLNGQLFSPDFSDLFAGLKFIADAGNGLLYWIAWQRGLGAGSPAAYTYDFANVFMYTSGLLNMLVVVDAFDIALGRKQ